MKGVLTRINRYPLKGFPGESLAQAILVAGNGIRHDRRFAIVNGSHAPLKDRKWVECKNFVRLTIDNSLARYSVAYDDENRQLSLSPPDENTTSVHLDCAIDREKFDKFLQQRFAAGAYGAAKLVEFSGDAAYWDFEDAPISIINIKTIEALFTHAPEYLAPDRFRGNLELGGLPAWEELSWIGRTITIGNVTLYVSGPIERCAATNVNPRTADIDCSVPHLLQTHFGHLYCGVYAKVIKSGEIETGDMVSPPPLFRPLIVQSVTSETADIVSLVVGDRYGEALPPFVSGQYVTVRGPTDGEKNLERSYTISNAPTSPQFSYRLSIKRKGATSTWLQSLVKGSTLEISTPKGGFLLKQSPRVPVLIAAGIGITPMLAMLKQLADKDPQRKVWLFYGVRNWEAFAFKDELELIVKSTSNVHVHLFFSRGIAKEKSSVFKCHSGRLSVEKIRHLLPFDGYEFYLCGPISVLRHLSEGLLRLGVNTNHMHIEQFCSTDEIAAQAAFPSQANIRFTESDRNGLWQEPSQTLLELAEQVGIQASYDCRAGTCGACRCVVKGKVHYAMKPVFTLLENEALLCCARPLENLEIKL